MSTPEFEQISLSLADRVLELRLNRPDRMNAFTPVMRAEIVEALDWAEANEDVRVVVVTGEGRAFCAGADLGSAGDKPFSYSGEGMRNEKSDADEIAGLPRDGGGVVTLRLASFPKPVIAAINGAAIGVGITMTLPMDIRIASTKAKFGFVFARRGIAPEAVSSWFLPRIVGISQAAEWALTGRVFDAEEALRGRLVSRVVEPDEVLSTAHAIAREIADNTSGVAVAATRRMLARPAGRGFPMQHRATGRGIAGARRIGSGRLAAWAAIGRVGSVSPQSFQEANLQSITAVVIGGISLFGGRGSIMGPLVGALIVGVFNSGLRLAGVDVLWQVFAIGWLTIVAVAIDQWIRKLSS